MFLVCVATFVCVTSLRLFRKRKPGGLAGVLEKVADTKKQKMSALRKSQLDWTTFKTEEGIEDDLAHQKKDGYLEKQAFLLRTDLRQADAERKEAGLRRKL